MRSRDEVLTVDTINDRLRELEQERHEDQGVISVWRGRTERAEQRIRELEAQQAASEPVAITDAMVEAAARAFYGAFYDGDRLWSGCPEDIRVWWMDAGRDALDAALTHPTTPTRGSDE